MSITSVAPVNQDSKDPTVGEYSIGHAAGSRNRLVELPPELLSDIILLAQWEDYKFPLVFSQVNTACRDFAISTPIIWSVINIDHSPNRIALHLSRSLGTPLDVRISHAYGARSLEVQPKDQLESFIATLSPYYHRIRSLRMVIDTTKPGVEDLAYGFLFDSNLKNLEILDVGVPVTAFLTTTTPGESHAGKGWMVKDLCLRGVQVTSSSRFFSSTLTRLHLCGKLDVSCRELIHILTKVPFLRHLVFEDFGFQGVAEPNQPPAPLQDLVELKFLRSSTPYVSDILLHITTPVLRSLTFVNHRLLPRDPPAPSEHPLITAAECNPQLRTIDLTQCDMEPEGWSCVLRSFPELTHLRIASSMLEASHLAPLHDDPTSFCPKLANIVFDNELFLSTSFVRAVVESRQHGTPPIRSLVLRGWDFSKVEVRDVTALRNRVPWLVLDMFASEVDQEEQEYGSSDGSDWSGEDHDADI